MFRTASRSAAVGSTVKSSIKSAVGKNTVVIAAAATAVTLTACGPVQMGAAAIIGTERVPTSTLSDYVSALNSVYQAHPDLQARASAKPAQMPQQVLTWLVQFRVIDEVARRYGVQVTPGDAQGTLSALTSQAGQQLGTPLSTTEYMMLNGLPPSLMGEFGHFLATYQKVVLIFTGGKNPSSLSSAQLQAASQRFRADIRAAADRLNIKINPRFGQLNVSQLAIAPTPDRLSKPESPA